MGRLKPFDLDKALNGEPALLRNGETAHIYAVIPNQFVEDRVFTLIGAITLANGDIYTDMCTWTKDGRYFSIFEEDGLDIIGMK